MLQPFFRRFSKFSVSAFSTVPNQNSVHRDASIGFSKVADQYEIGRPSYPIIATDLILNLENVSNATKIIDLGSGTGKFTKILQNILQNQHK